MQRLRSRLQVLLQAGADIEQAAQQYMELDKRYVCREVLLSLS
jgi:hypothetical protein